MEESNFDFDLGKARLGVIGGISYHSTILYYQKLNENFANRFGRERSAPILLYSHDFGFVVQCQQRGDWRSLSQLILYSGQVLKRSGCDAIMIASNTIHKFASKIHKSTGCQILHIADAVGKALKRQDFQKVGLLGTRVTMEEPFYRRFLEEHWSITLAIPSPEDRNILNRIIFYELVRGQCSMESRQWFATFCESWMKDQNLDALILGCTELNMLIDHTFPHPYVDSLLAHVESGSEYLESLMLKGGRRGR